MPANGVQPQGETIQLSSMRRAPAHVHQGEIGVVAGAPAGPCRARRRPAPARRTSDRPCAPSDSRPAFTWSSMTGTSVCTPVRPEWHSGQGFSLAARGCGAWSEPMRVHRAVAHRRPGGFPMPLAADRRVHHAVAAEPLVAVGRHLGQVVHQHLAGGDVAEILEVVEFLARSRRAGYAPAGRLRRASAISRRVPRKAHSSSRHSMWLAYGSPQLNTAPCGPAGGIRPRCERRCGGARRASRAQMLASSSTSRSPVELPANTLMAHTPRPVSRRGKARECWPWWRRHRGRCRTRRRARRSPASRPAAAASTSGGRGVRHVEHRGHAAEHGGPGAGGHALDAHGARRGRADAHAGRSGRAARAGRRRRSSPSAVGVVADAERGDAAVRARRRWSPHAPGQHAGAVADDQVIGSDIG